MIVNLFVLPLTFISNIWFPTNTLPKALRSIASAFPIKPLASSLQYAFDPRHHGAAFDWGSLRTLLIWAAVGIFLMVRFLRRPLGDDVP